MLFPWFFIFLGWIVPAVICWQFSKERWGAKAEKPKPGTLGLLFGGLQAGVGVLFFFAAGGFQNPYMPLIALFAAVVFWLPALLFIALGALKFRQFLAGERKSN